MSNKHYYTLQDAAAAGVAPWTEKVQEDFHVVIFEDKYPCTPGHLLFVPQYAADGVIEDCFADAFKHGKEMIEKGEIGIVGGTHDIKTGQVDFFDEIIISNS